MKLIDKILNFAEKHPDLNAILVSVIASAITSFLIILLKLKE